MSLYQAVMFERLFADSGLSLDRLRALVEVGAAGGISRASGGDPVKQSQYSRQIKELEGFFQTRLTERQGKGLQLTPNGRELTRISRFFLLGLSKFQQGCLAKGVGYRIGANRTFIDHALLPALFGSSRLDTNKRISVEPVGDDEIERRLHDLTLDFGVVQTPTLSRPLQLVELGKWHLKLWVPRRLARTEASARKAFQSQTLQLALPSGELPLVDDPTLAGYEPCLRCSSFIEARSVLESGKLAVVLPHFLEVRASIDSVLHVPMPAIESKVYHYRLAWNPRLLRLNPDAARERDRLVKVLSERMQTKRKSSASSNSAASTST